MQKVQLEKERINEQHRDRINEYELRLKKHEADKQKFETD